MLGAEDSLHLFVLIVKTNYLRLDFLVSKQPFKFLSFFCNLIFIKPY